MPPLARAHDKQCTKNIKVKKTKSRNGCGRCKLKRLKCDETAPSCLQCKKRNVACPGYEKTLKWSTKYEVLQPAALSSSPPKASRKANPTPKVVGGCTAPDVERHFEALAAVLPASKKMTEVTEVTEVTETAERNAPEQPTPATVESLSSSQESTPEPGDGSPPEPEPLQEPFFFEDLDALDPLLLGMESLEEAICMPQEDFGLEAMEGFSVDPGPFDCIDMGIDFDLDMESSQCPSSDDALSASLPSPRLSRSLLLDFYRLPNPLPSLRSADDVESVLIQHYFEDVCTLFSSFDSILNPFRTTIRRIFHDTPSIYYAIQSMSAAHLANTFPNMASVGVHLHRRAYDALQEELPLVQGGQASCTKTFLSIMLLGLTTSWHDAGALGEEFLTTARSLILPRLLSTSDGEEKQRETQFFEESLIYWEMLMGFVTQDAMAFAPSGLRARGTVQKVCSARKPDGKIVPHPWTGIAPTISVLFAEVGRLVRRECILDTTSGGSIRRQQENLQNAATLEEDLLAAEYPSASELADLGDERTAKQDFVVMAEAYRCAGLLELYRVFPSILRKRLGTDRSNWLENVNFGFPMPRFETPYEDTDTKLWLNSLAMHILDLIDSIPSSSGTISIQRILLATAASELRFVSSVDYFDVYANDAKVLRAREFAIKRLQEYAMRLPAKPIRRMIELIKEVWRRQDNGDNAYWINVMDEKNWQTVMG